jgi:copper transport protein
LSSTPWGRLLVAKVLVAGAAISAGAYNHRFLVSEMTAHPGDEGLIACFRSVVAIEPALLLIVGIVTAFLTGASSS